MTAPPPARRAVGVHLTPFCPGIRSLPLGHPRRWATLWSRTPRGAVAATLNRLGLSPQAVAVAPEAGGDIALMGRVRPEDLALIEGVGAAELVPFAIFFDGLTEAEVRAAVAELSAAGWAPARPLPPALITGEAA